MRRTYRSRKSVVGHVAHTLPPGTAAHCIASAGAMAACCCSEYRSRATSGHRRRCTASDRGTSTLRAWDATASCCAGPPTLGVVVVVGVVVDVVAGRGETTRAVESSLFTTAPTLAAVAMTASATPATVRRCRKMRRRARAISAAAFAFGTRRHSDTSGVERVLLHRHGRIAQGASSSTSGIWSSKSRCNRVSAAYSVDFTVPSGASHRGGDLLAAGARRSTAAPTRPVGGPAAARSPPARSPGPRPRSRCRARCRRYAPMDRRAGRAAARHAYPYRNHVDPTGRTLHSTDSLPTCVRAGERLLRGLFGQEWLTKRHRQTTKYRLVVLAEERLERFGPVTHLPI